MEGIDLAGVVDSDFQGIQINFAPPRPAGFANFHGAGRGGAKKRVNRLIPKILQNCVNEKYNITYYNNNYKMLS